MKKLNSEQISEKIMPAVTKFSQHKWVRSISSGFMYVIPFTLLAAIFTIIATPPVTEAVVAEGGFYGNLMSGWLSFAKEYNTLLTLPANMTTGLISVISVMGIAYTLTKQLKMKNELTVTITALIMFLIVCSPMTTGVLSALLTGNVDLTTLSRINMLDATNLGSQGLFVAIIIAISSVELSNFCIKHNFTLRFGDAIPDIVAAPFKALGPVIINCIFFFGLSILVEKTMNTTLPGLIMNVLMPTISNLNSFWGMAIVFTVCNILWFFGVHGAAVTSMLYIPLSFQLTAENAGIVASGGNPVWHPIFISAVSSAYIGLNLAMLIVGKSQKNKAVGKLALVPNLFNINEPLIFGAPMVFNVYLLIPSVLVPILQMLLMYILGNMGLIVGNYNILMVNLPLGLNQFFGTMSIMTALITVGIQLLGTLIWIPFVKIYDRQLLKEESLISEHQEEVQEV